MSRLLLVNGTDLLLLTNATDHLLLAAPDVGGPPGLQSTDLTSAHTDQFRRWLAAYQSHIDQGFLQLPAVVIGAPVGGEAFALPILAPIYDYTHIDQAFLQLPAAAPAATPINRYIGFLPIPPPIFRDYTFVDRGALRFPYVPPPPLPKNQYQWPVPAPAPLSIAHTAFITGPNNILLQGPPPVIIQVAARGSQVLPFYPTPTVRTWISPLNLDLISPPGLPFNQYNWPILARQRDQFAQRDRSFTASSPKVLVGQDKLPTGNQYSDRPPGPTWLANWINSVSQALLTTIPPPPTPFAQYDWPVPTGPRPAENLRTYIAESQIQFPVPPIPFRQRDWPLPVYPRPLTTSALTWISSVNILLLKPPIIITGIVARGSQTLPPAQLWPDRYDVSLRSITLGRAIYGEGAPPIIIIPPPTLGPVDHVKPYADQYYGVMYAEEVTRGEPHFAQYKGSDFKKAGN